jgi:hypothetical protein
MLEEGWENNFCIILPERVPCQLPSKDTGVLGTMYQNVVLFAICFPGKIQEALLQLNFRKTKIFFNISMSQMSGTC